MPVEMKQKKILLVSHCLGVTGAPTSLLRHAKYLLEAGHLVSVWTYEDGILRKEFERLGLSVEHISGSLDALEEIVRANRNQFDFVLCNTIVTWECALAWQRAGVPVAWFIRETALLDLWYVQNVQFAHAVKCFPNLYCPSEYAADVISLYNKQVRFITNSTKDEFRGYAPLAEHARFGYIGSIKWTKGVHLLIEAFLSVLKSHPNATLSLAGDLNSPLAKELLAKTKGVPNIMWLGEVLGEDKKRFFDSIDVLCVPSLDEPFGLTVAEGAMFGKALVVTDRTGAKIFVGNNASAIVKAGNRKALEKALRHYAAIGKNELRKLQENSRNLYLLHGTCQQERDAVLKMVSACCNDSSGRTVSGLGFNRWLEEKCLNHKRLRRIRRIWLSALLKFHGRGPWSRTGKRYF